MLLRIFSQSRLGNIKIKLRERKMKYRGKITNYVDSFRRAYPEINVITEPAGQFYAEFASEESAVLAEQMNDLVGKFKEREK